MAEKLLEDARAAYQTAVAAYLRTLWKLILENQSAHGKLRRAPSSRTQANDADAGRRGSEILASKRSALTRTNAPKTLVHSPLIKNAERSSLSRGGPTDSSTHSQTSYALRAAARMSVLKDQSEEQLLAHLTTSVSLLVVESTLKRALLRFTFCVLRCRVTVRHEMVDLAAEQHRRVCGRRAFVRWREAAASRRNTLSEIVTLWHQHTAARLEMRRRVHRFSLSLHRRGDAWKELQRRRTQRCFSKWQRVFHCNVERRAVSQFQARHPLAASTSLQAIGKAIATRARASGSTAYSDPLLLSVDAGQCGVVEVEATAGRDVSYKQFLFRLWKRKAERSLVNAFSLWTNSMRLKGLCFGTWKRKYKSPSLLLPLPQPEGPPLAASSLHIRNSVACTASAVATVQLEAFGSSHHHNLIVRLRRRCAEELLCHRRASDAFERWKCKAKRRKADAFYLDHTRMQVLRRWTLRRIERSEQILALLQTWRVWHHRLESRAMNQRAKEVRTSCQLRECFRVWQLKSSRRSMARFSMKRECFALWKCRWFRDVAEAQRLRVAWERWRLQCAARVERKSNESLAELIRVAVSLTFCFRRWRERRQHSHSVRARLAILHDLQSARLMRRCFSMWEWRTFVPAREL